MRGQNDPRRTNLLTRLILSLFFSSRDSLVAIANLGLAMSTPHGSRAGAPTARNDTATAHPYMLAIQKDTERRLTSSPSRLITRLAEHAGLLNGGMPLAPCLQTMMNGMGGLARHREMVLLSSWGPTYTRLPHTIQWTIARPSMGKSIISDTAGQPPQLRMLDRIRQSEEPAIQLLGLTAKQLDDNSLDYYLTTASPTGVCTCSLPPPSPSPHELFPPPAAATSRFARRAEHTPRELTTSAASRGCRGCRHARQQPVAESHHFIERRDGRDLQ